MRLVNTVLGPVAPEALGRTMMHEHLTIGLPGWRLDTAHPGPNFREMLAICTDKVARLRSFGVKSFVDPCPNDLGRDPRLALDVSLRTGMQIIVATGLYNEDLGDTGYWKVKFATAEAMGQDAAPYLAELFIKEITEGIGDSGVKAGIIKVATHVGRITAYEKTVLRAAALASNATGTPITTHTQQGELGLEQQAYLVGHGVPAHRIIIGHSDGSPDHGYHMRVVQGGSYLGFDRWGYQSGLYGRPDDEKIESLLQVLGAGGGRQIVVSCDYVCCYQGSTWPSGAQPFADEAGYDLMHFVEVILPKLRELGVSEDALELLMVENPRRYFCDEGLGR